jgi:hypothetical protein
VVRSSLGCLVVTSDDSERDKENVMSFMNEGSTDRVIRVVAGIVLLALGWGEVVTGTLGTVLKVLGFIPLLTGLVGWCPLYAITHISTRRHADEKSAAIR